MKVKTPKTWEGCWFTVAGCLVNKALSMTPRENLPLETRASDLLTLKRYLLGEMLLPTSKTVG